MNKFLILTITFTQLCCVYTFSLFGQKPVVFSVINENKVSWLKTKNLDCTIRYFNDTMIRYVYPTIIWNYRMYHLPSQFSPIKVDTLYSTDFGFLTHKKKDKYKIQLNGETITFKRIYNEEYVNRDLNIVHIISYIYNRDTSIFSDLVKFNLITPRNQLINDNSDLFARSYAAFQLIYQDSLPLLYDRIFQNYKMKMSFMDSFSKEIETASDSKLLVLFDEIKSLDLQKEYDLVRFVIMTSLEKRPEFIYVLARNHPFGKNWLNTYNFEDYRARKKFKKLASDEELNRYFKRQCRRETFNVAGAISITLAEFGLLFGIPIWLMVR